MKRILIITYYWPPAGGSGVQRWLKFVKYLTKKNYHCIVYTPENPETPVIDNSLLKDIPDKNYEVIKTKIIEPYSAYKILTGKSPNEKITVSFLNEKKQSHSLFENISKWIRGNIFIPDAKMLWIKPSVRFLSNYLKNKPVDILVSTGPPHSMHLIALNLKKHFPNIKWIADFRDPWTNIDFLNELKLSKWAKKKHQTLEKYVLQSADAVISVSPTLTKELSDLVPENSNKFYTITNGFDWDDFQSLAQQKKSNTPFTLTYAGLLPPNRNPEILWKAIAELYEENKLLPELFKVQLIGKTDISIIESIKKHNITDFIEKIDYLSHAETIKKEIESDALLLIINNAPNSKGILTGKLFEYLALQKPIIVIGPTDGDAAQIIYQTNAGVVVDFNDLPKMKDTLLKLLQRQIPASSKEKINLYSRESLTEQLIEIIKKTYSNKNP